MHGDVKIFDVHGHVSPPLGSIGLYSLMLQATNSRAASPFDAAMSGFYGFTDEAWKQCVDAHVAALDDRRIDAQVLGPRPFFMLGWLTGELQLAWTEFVNDCIARQVSMRPDRFVGACMLPQDVAAADASHCLAELERCAQLGFGGVYLSPDPTGTHSGPGLADTWWDPLYAKCQELDWTIIVHGTNSVDKRLRHVPNNYQLSFVAEQYWARISLGHSDVFDRFPGLRFLICHGGGALDRFLPGDPHLPSRDTSRNLFYDTCAHDTVFLRAAIEQRGAAQMAFGTEAPGSGGAKRPETGRPADDLVPVIEGFGFLTEAEKTGIFTDRPQDLFAALKKL